MNKEEQNITQTIEDAITSGRATMRPRWYFMLTGTLAVVAGVLIALVLLYLVSFIVFMLRENGVGIMPAFGPRGWLVFARNLPWLMIAVSLIFILLLELFVRRYAFIYRRPALYSAGGVIVLALVGGFLVASTELHPRFSEIARVHHVPLGERWYRAVDEEAFPNVFRGTILATTSEGLIIADRFGTSSVLISSSTDMVPWVRLEPGRRIFILGDASSSAITAVGLRTTMHPRIDSIMK